MLAREGITEVAQRSELDDVVVAAYAALFFDVNDSQQRSWWYLQHLSHVPKKKSTFHDVGIALRKIAFHGSAQSLEETIETLCRFEGDTLADGIPQELSLSMLSEINRRVQLASFLIPNKARQQQQLAQLAQALGNALYDDSSRLAQILELAYEILSSVTLPKSLAKRLAKVNYRPVSTCAG